MCAAVWQANLSIFNGADDKIKLTIYVWKKKLNKLIIGFSE
jgi:hypothetical protein